VVFASDYVAQQLATTRIGDTVATQAEGSSWSCLTLLGEPVALQ
jgi:hypothetical protein